MAAARPQRTTLLVVRTGTRDPLARHGIACPTVTGAGTGSFEFEAASGVYTELFEPSLFSLDDGDEPPGRGSRHRRRRPQGARLRFGAAARLRRARRDLRARLRRADEHRRLAVSAATNRLGLCDKIRLIPGHCDPTVNLYDWYVCVRGNRVEQIWPITARGAVY